VEYPKKKIEIPEEDYGTIAKLLELTAYIKNKKT